MTPGRGDVVAYQSLAGTAHPYEATVLEVGERGGEVVLTLDVRSSGTRAGLRRHLVPWSDDPACRAPGHAHPKEPAA